ncbi:MAG: hypothetical protein QW265_03630 [Candidatus Bathyarchaeia archaeon]
MMRLSRKEKIASSILLICLFLIVEAIATNYFMSYGLSKAGLTFSFLGNKIFIPAYSLPIIGVFAVILSTWDYLLDKIFYSKNRSKKIGLRVLEQVFTIMAIFTLFLFIPSIIVSNWFLGLISKLYNAVPGLKSLLNTLIQPIISSSNIDNFLIFVLIQNLAGFATVFFVLLLTRIKLRKG